MKTLVVAGIGLRSWRRKPAEGHVVEAATSIPHWPIPAGRIPTAEPRAGMVSSDFAGDRVPANRYGVYDMIANVWEWTTTGIRKARSRCGEACCIPKNPPRWTRAESPRPMSAASEDSTQGAQRGLASLRAQLLAPLRPARAPCTPVDTSPVTSDSDARSARPMRT